MKLNQNNQQNSQVKLSTKVNQTESQTKVIKSIKNIIPKNQDIIQNITKDKIEIIGNTELLDTIKTKIKQEQYSQLAQNILTGNKNEDTTYMYINKQSAYNNKFHIINENMAILSDIKLTITSPDIDEIIEYLTE